MTELQLLSDIRDVLIGFSLVALFALGFLGGK